MSWEVCQEFVHTVFGKCSKGYCKILIIRYTGSTQKSTVELGIYTFWNYAKKDVLGRTFLFLHTSIVKHSDILENFLSGFVNMSTANLSQNLFLGLYQRLLQFLLHNWKGSKKYCRTFYIEHFRFIQRSTVNPCLYNILALCQEVM